MIGLFVEREAVITPVEADAKKKPKSTSHRYAYKMYEV